MVIFEDESFNNLLYGVDFTDFRNLLSRCWSVAEALSLSSRLVEVYVSV